MPSAPILCMGSRWKAEDIFWRSAPKNAQVLGVPARAKRSAAVNFAQQSGIYVLYSDFVPIYVGQANCTLFSRLKMHYLSGDFVGRWDRFTWFGFRAVIGGVNPSLKKPGSDFHISTNQLLDHLEAMLIHSYEPRLNGQEGRFGKSVVRYKQVRDPRLGPNDRDLLEGMAVEGDLVPSGKRITPTGWKDV
jgi:hypothetical protein